MGTFADLISLGGNCECGFGIRHAGQERSHYFDWTNATADIAARVIEDEFGFVQQPEHLSPDEGGLLLDNRYGYKFYGPWSQEKLRHMIDRFMNPGGPRCYILKTAYETPYALARLLDALAFVGGDFVLVHLRPAEFASQPIRLKDERIHERYLRRYAPLEDAEDIHLTSWNRLFAEFKLEAMPT